MQRGRAVGRVRCGRRAVRCCGGFRTGRRRRTSPPRCAPAQPDTAELVIAMQTAILVGSHRQTPPRRAIPPSATRSNQSRTAAITGFPPNPRGKSGPSLYVESRAVVSIKDPVMSEHVESNSPEFQPKEGRPKADKADGQTMSEVSGTAAPSGDNVVPLPAKKAGLTLESLQRATVSGDVVPPTTIVSTAVVIDVTKPTKGVPFRAHPDVAYTMKGYSLTMKTPGVIGDTIYLVDPAIAEMIPPHVRYQRFASASTRGTANRSSGQIRVQVEATGNAWVTSANRIWEAAKEDWVCLIPVGGAYSSTSPSCR